MIKHQLRLFVIGAVLGTALDHLHVAGGVTSYAAPFAFGQAIWVPPLFGAALLGLSDLHRRLRRFSGAAPDGGPAAVARDLLLFTAAYSFTAFARLPSAAILALLLAAWCLRALLVRERPHRLAHALLAGVCGVLVEWQITGTGGFRYRHPDFLRVALWLPALYLLAAPCIGELDDWLGPAD